MAESAYGIYFCTGLEACRLPWTGDDETLLAALDQTGTTYLLARYPTDSPYNLPTEMERLSLTLDKRKDSMKLAYRFDASEIYRVD